MLIVVVLIALAGVFYLVGSLGGDDPEQEAGSPTPTPQAGGEDGGKDKEGEKEKKKPKKPTRVKLQIQPIGPVSVCLENGEGEVLIGNLTLDVGQDSEVFKEKRFVVSFGTPSALMVVDGKEYPVSQAAPIGYDLRPGKKPQELPESERPTCAG